MHHVQVAIILKPHFIMVGQPMAISDIFLVLEVSWRHGCFYHHQKIEICIDIFHKGLNMHMGPLINLVTTEDRINPNFALHTTYKISHILMVAYIRFCKQKRVFKNIFGDEVGIFEWRKYNSRDIDYTGCTVSFSLRRDLSHMCHLSV